MGGFQYPETAHVLLGLGVWPIGDEHRTIRLLPHRLCVAGRGNSAGELPDAGSNQFAVECVDLLDSRFVHYFYLYRTSRDFSLLITLAAVMMALVTSGPRW